MRRRKFRETLVVIILSVMAQGETHGYDIIRTIERITLGNVKLSPGTLYPLLFIMRREGLIKVVKIDEEGRKKKVYCLTPKGREYLIKHIPSTIKYLKSLVNFLEDISNILTAEQS